MTIHQCPNEFCGKTWNDNGGAFPLCVNNGCQLRQIRFDQGRRASKLEQFNTMAGCGSSMVLSRQSAPLSLSLEAMRETSPAQFSCYNMEGAKSASTTVRLRNGQEKIFVTADQMHSEMCAIQYMLDQGEWFLLAGNLLWCHNGTTITVNEFHTTEPHCGFCTIFLLAAGLPVGRPTYGNHQLAGRHNYQLPRQLMRSPEYLCRVIGNNQYRSYTVIKVLLNAFCNMPPDSWVLEFQTGCYADDTDTYVELNGRTVVLLSDVIASDDARLIWLIWVEVYKLIAVSNKEGAKGF